MKYKKDPTKHCSCGKLYFRSTKICFSCNPLYIKAHQLLSGSKRRAKYKRMKFELDLDWIYNKLLGKCEVTGLSFEIHKGRSSHSLSPSIDRIDNKLGYTKDNCRLVIFWFNVSKGINSDWDTWHLCNLLVNSLDGKPVLNVKTTDEIDRKII